MTWTLKHWALQSWTHWYCDYFSLTMLHGSSFHLLQLHDMMAELTENDAKTYPLNERATKVDKPRSLVVCWLVG